MDRHMRMALALARQGDPRPNPRVGAVLVRDGIVLGSGFHKGPGRPHAEIEAIEEAESRSGNRAIAKGATLYVTLEPCSHTIKRTPPCTLAIIDRGIGEVVYGMEDPNPLVEGAEELEAAGIKVRGPVCPEEASAINRGYIKRITRMPHVAIKMAMSADGKSATCAGDSRWISGKASREMVHRMRASYDAVMVGAGTVMMDDPALTSHGKGKDPFRVIVDGALSLDPKARAVSRKDGKAIVATTCRAPSAKLAALPQARILFCGEEEVDMRRLLRGLGAMGMKRILIEGGSELNAKALESGMVSRMLLFVAPKLIGGSGAKPVVGGAGISRMAQAGRLELKRMKKVGEDLLLEYEVL